KLQCSYPIAGTVLVEYFPTFYFVSERPAPFSCRFACGCECLFSGTRIVPSSGRRDMLDFSRAPGVGGILINRCILFQHWLDNAPRFFDVVLACKQCTVSCHCCSEHAFICVHFVGTW